MSSLVLTRPAFVPFSIDDLNHCYGRRLPHWRQPGATYWVTARLTDSVPEKVLRRWGIERRNWLAARGIDVSDRSARLQDMVRQLSPEDRSTYRRYFEGRMEKYLDTGHGACYLAQEGCVQIVRDLLLREDGVTCHVGDFVIMPNHAHLLIVPMPGHDLEDILRLWKGASAHDCNQLLGRRGPFWRKESFDHIVRSLDHLQAYRNYNRDNPIKAGITISPLAYYRASWMDDWFGGYNGATL